MISTNLIFKFLFVVLIMNNICDSAKLPNEDAEQGSSARAHDHKLSDLPHYTDKDKDNKFEHNEDYDHEAFLGKDEADKFKQLTPEESKQRLGKIVDKIDTDKDGFVSLEELINWLKNVSHKHIMKDVDSRWESFSKNSSLDEYIEINYGALNFLDKIDKNRDGFVSENELRNWIRSQQKYYLQKNTDKKWKELNTDEDELLTFDELIDNTIGQPDTWTDEEKELKKSEYKTYLKLMERDKKRFKAADHDGDGKLNKKEYADFLHPEESSAMRDIVIDETMEDLDKNGDGVVNIDEYIDDIYPNLNSDEERPESVVNEIESFKLHRDKNNDSVLDREEVANWILPTDFDHTLSEAKHLIFEVDENADGKLTKDEILEKYSVFVASQATGYGQAIYEREDL